MCGFCFFFICLLKLFFLCWVYRGRTKSNTNKNRCLDGLVLGNSPLSLIEGNCFEFWSKSGSLRMYHSVVIFLLSILESYSFRMGLGFHLKIVEVIRKINVLFEYHHNELVRCDFDDVVEGKLVKCFLEEVYSIVGVLLYDINLYVKDDSLHLFWEHKLFLIRFTRL